MSKSFDYKAANIKQLCNYLDVVSEETSLYSTLAPDREKEKMRDFLNGLLYYLAAKQLKPGELQYLQMRSKSPNYLMRG